MAAVGDRSADGDQRRNGSEGAGGGNWFGGANGFAAPVDRPKGSSGLRRRLGTLVHDWRLRLVIFADKRALRERALRRPKRLGRWFQRSTLTWGGARRKWRPQVWAALILTGVLAAIILGAAIDFLFGWTPPIHPRAECHRHEFGCGVLGATLVTVLAAAVAFTWLILVRVFRIVNSGYARAARKRPSEFVPTAADIGQVVGRDDLCRVIEKELRAEDIRRPQVIVGGVGAGKTAVLVRLTRWLVERGAVPVAVRLRDLSVDEGLLDLAGRRFKNANEHRFKSNDEADRIWRRLCANGVVVVLADGLEEALSGTDARETSIRQALDDARRRKLPLVVTSRPDEALVTLDAALIELGPVDEQKALDYVRESRRPGDVTAVDDRSLRLLMAAAKVAEMPLYLQLTHDLYERNLLAASDLTDLDDDHRLDIRLRLLENWQRRVEEGGLAREPSITTEQRQFAIQKLADVAAIALVRDTLELKFKVLAATDSDSSAASDDSEARAENSTEVPEPRSTARGIHRLVQVDPLSARVASNIGARLGIVETLRAGVRFRHSIMEAYLGSLWIRKHGLERDDYLDAGLKNGGREFLMALTMACARYRLEPEQRTHRNEVLGKMADRLSRAAVEASRDKSFPEDRRVLLIAAAYEIDGMAEGSRQTSSRSDAWRRGRFARVASTWRRRNGSPSIASQKRGRSPGTGRFTACASWSGAIA